MANDPRDRSAGRKPAGEESADTVSLRHLNSPVSVKLNIRFSADSAPHPSGGAARIAAEDMSELEQLMPPGSLKKLRDLDAKVMAWLAKSDENRLLFASDPLAALLKIDSKLDIAFIKQLRRASEASGPPQPVDPRVRLERMELRADKAPGASGGRPPSVRK